MRLDQLLRHARGEIPADRLLVGGRVVDVLSGEIREEPVAIAETRIVGLGDYEAEEVVDLDGAYVAPGFIDAHVHVESSLVPPAEFAAAVVPRGTTTVVADPHEIANVLGIGGIRFMLADAERVPLTMYVMAPSSVPATDMETGGAKLAAEELVTLIVEDGVIGLAEVMDYQGVVSGKAEVLEKLEAFAGFSIDGHCPGLSGKELMAYAAAGIRSDHESTTLEEAREKLRAGLTVFIREASVARNLRDLLPLVSLRNQSSFCFCTDDRQPADLLGEGSIDHLVRLAISEGLDPLLALRLASYNAAAHYRFDDRGAITPGRRADLVVFSDLEAPRPHRVFRGGVEVARDGRLLLAAAEPKVPALPPTVRVDWSRLDFRIEARGRRARVIGLRPGQLATDHLVAEPRIDQGLALPDPARDLLELAVIERHSASGSQGLGFVKGLGLARGAIASTVAHDHHNLIVAGADHESMRTAALRAVELAGGMVVAVGDRVLAELPLPIAGLMSDQPIAAVRDRFGELVKAATELGSSLADPFTALSFLGLEVIPSLKLTDRGLVDVDRFELVPLWVDS